MLQVGRKVGWPDGSIVEEYVVSEQPHFASQCPRRFESFLMYRETRMVLSGYEKQDRVGVTDAVEGVD
jgi:hypothetical protein